MVGSRAYPQYTRLDVRRLRVAECMAASQYRDAGGEAFLTQR